MNTERVIRMITNAAMIWAVAWVMVSMHQNYMVHVQTMGRQATVDSHYDRVKLADDVERQLTRKGRASRLARRLPKKKVRR